MLETLSRGFQEARERLQGVQKLNEENIDTALRDVRMSLLEADVDFQVAKDFLARVKERALGEKVATRVRDRAGKTLRISAGQHFVKICEEELIALMGPVEPGLASSAGATTVMLVGLQGVGKTTVAAKLARHLQKAGKRPLLVAADLQRPAAVLQLQQLGESIDVTVHTGSQEDGAPTVCATAAERARREGFDAIIYDTAGRLAIDDDLMGELEQIRAAAKPANTILVCDALMGRDAINVAQGFSERLPLDGLVLTKLDGDARGGAALAVKAVTGIPIKFLGTGETVDRLEEFRPEGLASRILGMGDVVGLVKDFEEVVDQKEAEDDAERILKGNFGMDDLLKQLRTIQKMGPLREVFGRLPGMGGLADQVDERELTKVESMIQSMTGRERSDPDSIDKSRAQRIARGSGRAPKEVEGLVERFGQMRQMMGALGGGGGMLSKIPGLGKLGGGDGMPGFDPSMLAAGAGAAGGAQQLRRSTVVRQRKSQKAKRKQSKKDRRKGRKK
jgi:signal recognition particle subunit SRP54